MYTPRYKPQVHTHMVILFDQYNLPSDIYEILFATPQQEIVARILIDFIKENNNEINKTQMSFFASKLHEGTLEATVDKAPYSGKVVRLSYNKRQFYDRILTPMKSMGLIKYDMYKKTYALSTEFCQIIQRIGVMWSAQIH
jgi:hypothetical protein